MFRPVKQKAFTLLELIVVLVILAVLAAIAVPTFQKVIQNSQDASTKTTVEAMLRDTQALMAFQDGTTWEEATVIAAAETGAAYAPGTSAAGRPVVEFDTAAPADPQGDEVVYSISSDATALVLAALSPSGNVCIGAATETNLTRAECLAPSDAAASSTESTVVGAALAGDVLSLPGSGTTEPAPTAPAEPVPAPGQLTFRLLSYLSMTIECSGTPCSEAPLTVTASGLNGTVPWYWWRSTVDPQTITNSSHMFPTTSAPGCQSPVEKNPTTSPHVWDTHDPECAGRYIYVGAPDGDAPGQTTLLTVWDLGEQG